MTRMIRAPLEASLLAQSHALLDLTMMMFTAGGRERTAKQFEALVSVVDLRLERIIPMRIPSDDWTVSNSSATPLPRTRELVRDGFWK
jgi:hypothetical protein